MTWAFCSVKSNGDLWSPEFNCYDNHTFNFFPNCFLSLLLEIMAETLFNPDRKYVGIKLQTDKIATANIHKEQKDNNIT